MAPPEEKCAQICNCPAPYRRALSREEALAYIRGEAGRHFDPQVVGGFARLLEEEAKGNIVPQQT
ncbi:MAG: hypothetical protein HY334_01010 [Armatimonadetes bacterium]|nr:hypothetical protein [Armatimonadota bacterium]